MKSFVTLLLVAAIGLASVVHGKVQSEEGLAAAQEDAQSSSAEISADVAKADIDTFGGEDGYGQGKRFNSGRCCVQHKFITVTPTCQVQPQPTPFDSSNPFIFEDPDGETIDGVDEEGEGDDPEAGVEIAEEPEDVQDEVSADDDAEIAEQNAWN